jgi:hypothetical protein
MEQTMKQRIHHNFLVERLPTFLPVLHQLRLEWALDDVLEAAPVKTYMDEDRRYRNGYKASRAYDLGRVRFFMDCIARGEPLTRIGISWQGNGALIYNGRHRIMACTYAGVERIATAFYGPKDLVFAQYVIDFATGVTDDARGFSKERAQHVGIQA